MPKKKQRITKSLKKYAWIVGYIGLIFSVVHALWRNYNPSVVIQKETQYRTTYVMEPLTETQTTTATLTTTVTRVNGTVEDLTKPP